MKPIIKILMIVAATAAANVQAENEPLFPDVENAAPAGSTLSGAITQFERILEEAPSGDLQSLESNSQYNEEKTAELRSRLEQKRKALESLPDVVGRQFDAMMAQYKDADQQDKDRIAHELQSKAQETEARLRLEIDELTEQLASSTTRAAESDVKKQMLRISTSLSESDITPVEKDSVQQPRRTHQDAFENMQSLSRKRTVSKVQALCRLQVKPVDNEFSLSCLDK